MDMGNRNKIVSAAYQQIAVDIAKNIINGKYTVGQKLSGRSTLASHYSVSPETIRRAVYILKDVGIVKIEKGSGIEIVSIDSAFKFIEQFEEVQNIGDIKIDILNWIKKQKEDQDVLMNSISSLLDITERYSEINPFTPFALQIKSDMNHIGKTSSEVNFWQNTGATIIAVKRDQDIILSPGPYTSFNENDILYFIGNNECLERVKKLFLSK